MNTPDRSYSTCSRKCSSPDETPTLSARQSAQRRSAAVYREPQVSWGDRRRDARTTTVYPASQASLILPPPPRTTRPRSSSFTRDQRGVEILVDVSADKSRPPTTPQSAPITLPFQPLVPTRVSLPRPKSSYHPSQDLFVPETSTKQPEDKSISQPTSSHKSCESPAAKPRTCNKMSETSSGDSGLFPLYSEVLEHQAKALQKIEEHRRTGVSTRPEKPKRSCSTTCPSWGSPGSLSKTITDHVNKDDVNKTSLAGGDSPAGTKGAADYMTRLTPAVSSNSNIIDPFLTVDPFPPVDPNTEKNYPDFAEGSSLTSAVPINSDASLNAIPKIIKTENKEDSPQTPVKPTVGAATVGPDGDAGASGDIVSAAARKVGHVPSRPPRDLYHGGSDPLGESILDALDFAVTPTASHQKVSPQKSKGTMASRCYSEDTLLDCSYNTLENFIDSSKRMAGSRASIIEEFDPLVLPSPGQESSRSSVREKNKKYAVETPVKAEEVIYDDHVKPKTIKSKLEKEEHKEDNSMKAQRGEEDSDVFLPEEGAVAADGYQHTDAGVDDLPGYYESDETITSPNYTSGVGESSLSSTGSCTSWPADYIKNSSWSPPPVTPPSAGALGEDNYSSWSSDHEEPDTPPTGAGVGRSAFYRPLAFHKGGGGGGSGRWSTEGGAMGVIAYRDLLKIREGVKIFFIHNDGVVTSPWNRPFLAASKDTNCSWFVGEGVVLRVGNNLWSCRLHSKSTLVLHTLSGVYMFKDAAGKPDCMAVGVRIPSQVRKVQHQLLANILNENTLLEDERPTGITKAISQGALSAATRMNQFVEEKSMTTNKAFIRKNSIRALKGVSRRLNRVAERTGSTMTELPAEYNKLQEAANMLHFSRTAKTVQYI